MTWNNLSKANETSFHKNIVDSNLKAMLFSSIFGSIAVLSFLGNLLLCLVICRHRKRLSKPYNILMINRAAMDMLIGLNFFKQIQSDFNHNSQLISPLAHALWYTYIIHPLFKPRIYRVAVKAILNIIEKAKTI